MKKFISFLLIIILSLTAMPSINAQAAIKLTKSKLTLSTGASYNLKLTGTTKTIKWTSSNQEIATVSSKGKVTAVKEGVANIIATVNKSKYTCKVTVKEYTININAGDWSTKYLKFEKITSVDGEPGILVYFNFKNDSSEALEFLSVFGLEAYQNGIECDTYVMFENAPEEFENRDRKIKDEAEIDLCFSILLQDESSPVDLEILDYNDFKKYSQTIKLQ